MVRFVDQMRHRWPVALLIAALPALAGWHDPGYQGVFTFDLYDAPVRCETERESCTLDGQVVPPERASGEVYLNHDSNDGLGTYAYLELVRAGGHRALLELDLFAGGPYQVTYREWAAENAAHPEAPVFEAHHVAGVIALPGSDCEVCFAATFELVLTDAGADETLGTDDDTTRHLSAGRIGRASPACKSAHVQSAGTELRVHWLPCPGLDTPIYTPRPRPVAAPRYEDSYYDAQIYVATEGGCGGEAPPPDDVYYDDSGCEGDDIPDDSYGGEGCEGDTSDSSGSEGCEDDGYDDSGDCEGDAHAATLMQRPPRKRRSRSIPTLPWLLGGLVVLRRAHRARRRR